MRLIDVILRSWSLRQHIQQQYERALPQTQLNTAYLESLADSKPTDRMADKPDFIERASNFAESQGKKPFTRADLPIPDRQPHSVNPADIKTDDEFGSESAYQYDADGFPIIRQQGAIPQGGRRHLGILVWEFVVNRLRQEGIVLECDDEYAALDSMYCEKVAELAAEMFQLRRECPGAAVPLEATWVREIEQRADNEAIAELIIADLVTHFGVRPERIESEQRRIEASVAGMVIPAEVLNPTREAQPLPRQVRPKVDTGGL